MRIEDNKVQTASDLGHVMRHNITYIDEARAPHYARCRCTLRVNATVLAKQFP